MVDACLPGVLAAAGEAGVVADLVLVLGAAAFAVLVLSRVGVAAIPALILTGALIGPNALGWVPAPAALGAIGHLAIIFLLFGVGLELHLDALRPGTARLLLAGGGAVAGSVLLGWPLGTWAAGSVPAGLAVAMAFSLSSTAVVLKYMAGRRELTQTPGRLALSILVVQDLAVIGMLAAIPLLARWAGVEGAVAAADGAFGNVPDALLRVGGVALLVMLGRRLFPPLLREALRAGGSEALLLVGAALALGSAGACERLGFSLELGAFLAGFVLADTPFQEQLRGQLAPVRDLFMAVFFTTLGMNVDPAAALAHWPWLLAGLGVLVVGKALVVALACWGAGVHAATATVVAVYLAHGGEFSLVLLDEAGRAGLLGAPLRSTLVVLVVAGLLVMPAVAALARRLAPALREMPLAWAGGGRLAAPYAQDAATDQATPVVLVAGYGPVGRRVSESLLACGQTPVVVDLNPRTVTELEAQGRRAVLGDVQAESVLEAAGIEHALALVLTVPDGEVVRRATRTARRMRSDLWIAARAPVARARSALVEAGADVVCSDEEAASVRLTTAVVAGLRARGVLVREAGDTPQEAPPPGDSAD